MIDWFIIVVMLLALAPLYVAVGTPAVHWFRASRARARRRPPEPPPSREDLGPYRTPDEPPAPPEAAQWPRGGVYVSIYAGDFGVTTVFAPLPVRGVRLMDGAQIWCCPQCLREAEDESYACLCALRGLDKRVHST